MLNRKIWKRCHNLAVCVLLLFFLGACVSSLPPPGKASPLKKQGLFKGAPTDTDLLYEGITYLGSTGQPNDYTKARSAFDTLLKSYPKSKWRSMSETLIRLIDNIQSCQEKELHVRNVQQENERLKREIRALNDKLQAETSRLQLLKDLEIQLDKREKMLR